MRALRPQCSSCICREQTLFAVCGIEDLEKVSTDKDSTIYKKGQILYLEGSKPFGVFCIYSGKVKIIKTNKEGKERIIKILKPGDNTGYQPLISGDSYSNSAIVMEEAEICFVPKESFFEIVRTNSAFSGKLLEKLALDFREVEELIRIMSFKPVRERLADAFLLLKKINNHTDETALDISVSRENLSNLIGTAKETTTRFLAEFRNENIIRVEGKKIRVLNWEKISEISRMYD